LFRGFPDDGFPDPSPLLNNFRNQANLADYHTSPPTITSSGGGQGCHGAAQTQKGQGFSFLYTFRAGVGDAPDVIGIPSVGQAAARLARKNYFR
jgi:hypothetical protein